MTTTTVTARPAGRVGRRAQMPLWAAQTKTLAAAITRR